MKRLLPPEKTIRVLGFDDAPFRKVRGATVNLCGVVCTGTRFEGMLWGKVRRDGWGATDELVRLVTESRFRDQLHLVLLDGVGFGGLNLVDMPRLAEELELPCVAVMRRRPDLPGLKRVIRKLPRPEKRLAILGRAGEIHEHGDFVFQAHGLTPAQAADALRRVTDRGKVPEALRLAHLIGSAVKLGESRGGA